MIDEQQWTEPWQSEAIASILEMVQSPDGDFGVLAKLSQATSESQAVDKSIEYLCQTELGRQAFTTRPRLNAIDLEHLSQLPSHTLGYRYAQHMRANNLKPILGGEVHSDLDFLSAHIAETHDIWHVLTGSDTNILGEIQLEAFYVGQMQASRFWTALLAKNLLKAVLYDIEVAPSYLAAMSSGWQMAKQAKPLFGVDWQQWWTTPLPEVRSAFNLVVHQDKQTSSPLEERAGKIAPDRLGAS